MLTKRKITVPSSGGWKAVLFLISVLVIFFILMETGWAEAVPTKHVGHGTADEIAQCITANTGLKVLVYEGFSRRFSEIQCQRRQSGQDTIGEIQQHGFRVLADAGWAFLVPQEVLTGVGWPIKVSRTGLKVNVDVEPASAPSGLTISADVLGSLKQKLVQEARLIPVVGSGWPGQNRGAI